MTMRTIIAVALMFLEPEEELQIKLLTMKKAMENYWGQVQSKLWLEKVKQPCNTDFYQDDSSSKWHDIISPQHSNWNPKIA